MADQRTTTGFPTSGYSNGFAFEWETSDGQRISYDDETEEWKIGDSVEGRMSAFLARHVLAKILEPGSVRDDA